MNPLQAASEAEYGAGDYIPPVRTTYWSMRIMAYAGSLVFFVLAVAAFFYRRRTLATKPWLLWVGVATIPLPYVAALAGWVLTEVGRQPWIVFGLLKTVDANSPSVSTTTIAFSLGVVRGALRRAGGRRRRSSCAATRASTRPRSAAKVTSSRCRR